MMDILLRQGPCDGEVVQSINESSRSHRRHPNGKIERYVNSGQIDPMTKRLIFVYAPLRRRGTA